MDVENDILSSRTTLAADPNPPKSPPPPAPVLDLALLLDIPDECVVRRAFSQAGMLHWWDCNAVYVCTQTFSVLWINVNCMFVWLCGSLTNTDTAAAAETSDPTDRTLYLGQIPHR